MVGMPIALRGRGFILSLTLFVAALAVLAIPGRASAAPYPPSQGCVVSISDGTVGPGGSVNLVGSGFPANESVGLSIYSTTTSIGSVRTDADGNFATTVDIPSSIGPGEHAIEASSASTTCSFGFGTDPVTVNRPPGDNGTNNGAASTGATASTGFEAITASIIAGILLVGGGVLLLLGRRRRNA